MTMDLEEEFPYNEFPWKLIYKDDKVVRKCFFQTEAHRNTHIKRYNVKKKDITFIGYKFDD